MSEWYEVYGNRYCYKCGKLIPVDEKGNFCKEHASDILMGVGASFFF